MKTTTLTGSLPESQTNPQPEIEVFRPEKDANGRALIIFPGGGYQHLSEHEGKGYAEWYQQRGYTCFVVAYRLGSQGFRHPAMIEDAAAAVCTIRKVSESYGVDPGKTGVMGSSAGGHLAGSLLVHWKEFGKECRPDFGILCYPVITFTEKCQHGGSKHNLLGEDPDPGLVAHMSCEKQVGPETPPCFLWHTAEDEAVPVKNSLLFGDALNRNGVPVELHVYPHGRHGLGLDTSFPWAEATLRWMDELLA